MGRRLGTILYITYYFFYIAYYWYVEKDPTRQIPVQRLFYIGLICFVVKIILTKYQWKEVIIGAAGAVLMYLCWKSSGGIDYPANYLIILAMKDVDLCMWICWVKLWFYMVLCECTRQINNSKRLWARNDRSTI